MRILLLTESLGAGGAERQLCLIAVGLKQRGHDPIVVTYTPGFFYLPLLQEANVPHLLLTSKGKIDLVMKLRQVILLHDIEAALAFLPSSSAYLEVLSLPGRKWGLVVAERSAVPGSHKKLSLKRRLHTYADYITCNTHANRLQIEQVMPSLKNRTVTIYNAVDMDRFFPLDYTKDNDIIRFVVASSYTRNKNMLGLLQAMMECRSILGHDRFRLDWYGDFLQQSAYDEAIASIQDYGMQNQMSLNPVCDKIADEYRAADAVVLASFYEGLPNTVCEAMACGKPIIASAISDMGNLVIEGENGFMFDPASPKKIGEALAKFCKLSNEERNSMGRKSIEMAKELFDMDNMISKYIEILDAASVKSKKHIESLPPNVPDTARGMLI